MLKVKLTITDSRCRSGYFKKGQEYIVGDLCPPLCHELWNSIYPMVYALLNGAELDYGNTRAKMFDAKCPDECRVSILSEVKWLCTLHFRKVYMEKSWRIDAYQTGG